MVVVPLNGVTEQWFVLVTHMVVRTVDETASGGSAGVDEDTRCAVAFSWLGVPFISPNARHEVGRSSYSWC